MNMPLMIDLSNKKVVIVGGGKVATRRTTSLLAYTNHIHVVSPTITDTLQKYLETKQITYEKKLFEPQDVENADMVIAATNQSDVNNDVGAALSKNVLFNDAGQADLGNIAFPNFLKRDKLTISVSTDGASPKLGQRIIKDLKDTYNEDYSMYIQFLYESRQYIKSLKIEPSDKQALLEQILSDKYLDEKKQQDFIRWLKSQVK